MAIGPVTNIALFINEYPETARKVERIVIMGGGARDVLGNATPTAEFNIYYAHGPPPRQMFASSRGRSR